MQEGKGKSLPEFKIAWVITALVLLSFCSLIAWKGWPEGVNEIGDAIAGPASLLAFVWLIVTIQLQYKELVQQRAITESMYEETVSQTKFQREATEANVRSVEEQLVNLQLDRVRFVASEKDRHRQNQDREVSQLLNQLIFMLVPALEKAPSIQARMQEEASRLEKIKLLLSGKQYEQCLISFFGYASTCFGKFSHEKSLVFGELENVENVREILDLLKISLIRYDLLSSEAPAEAKNLIYGLQVELIEKELSWLIDARERFGTSLDRFSKTLAEIRKEHNAVPD